MASWDSKLHMLMPPSKVAHSSRDRCRAVA
jgi:hypothetical protein